MAGCIAERKLSEQVTHHIDEIVRSRMAMIPMGHENGCDAAPTTMLGGFMSNLEQRAGLPFSTIGAAKKLRGFE